MKVEKPLFWDIETSNMYKAVTCVYQDDNLVHEEVTDFGFRTIEFNATDGFFLNGKKYKLKVYAIIMIWVHWAPDLIKDLPNVS